jgi:voltage-gated potassium channel
MFEIKKRVFEIIEAAQPGDTISRAFDIFIMTLISLNLLSVVMDTVKSVREVYGGDLLAFEHFSIVVFTLEYVLRIWSCTSSLSYARPITGRLRYALTPLVLIDLLAIAPFYLPMIVPLDLLYVRAIRLFRFVRVLKLGRYSHSLQLLGAVLRNKKEDLLVSLIVIVVVLFVASSVMFYVEQETQPELFSSIPATLWWGVSTLTTVGYGDMVPISPAGKLVGAVIQLLGLGIVALPAGILAAGFIEERHKRIGTLKCPHCGKDI